ncbi:MAG: ABC transporter ATP-binding protein [Candidatus Limivivens sp.]|nr:ABC transporter ATP-binding protein [Candidatus Limivivens sp.]
MKEKQSFLEAEKVTFCYFEKAKRNILENAAIQVKNGGITVLIGNSGCGKSTLSVVLAGLYPENGGFLKSGRIVLEGKELKEHAPAERTASLSLMFQNPDLQFCMDTLRKEMRFCLENISVPKEEMDDRIEYWAQKLHMESMLDRKLYTLSGGEKQKAALACLFLLESRGVLLDEPFANLDEDSARGIIEMLVKIQKERGLTVIAIDHRLDLWLDAADEILVLGEGGRILERGIRKENLPDYRKLFSEQGLSYPEPAIRKEPSPQNARPALVLKDTSVKPWILEAQASFPMGKVTALLGSSGAGKTTLFQVLLKQKPYEGSICFDFGEGLQELSGMKKKELFANLGIVFQNPGNQFLTSNVREEVAVSIRRWSPKLSEEEMDRRVLNSLTDYGLEHYRKYSPYMLSQGQQRRLAVLAVLSGRQKVLLLDEPTYGQDDRSTRAIMQQLMKKVEEEGLTVIFTTHDEKLALRYADKIYRLRNQRLTEDKGEGYHEKP